MSTSDGTDERRKGILAGAEAAGGRPRLHKKKEGEQGEVPIPAYFAMQREPQLGSWMLETAVPLAQNRDNYLPKELRDRGKVVVRAVFRLPAKEGMAKLREAGAMAGEGTPEHGEFARGPQHTPPRQDS